jgi:hypothetical protein
MSATTDLLAEIYAYLLARAEKPSLETSADRHVVENTEANTRAPGRTPIRHARTDRVFSEIPKGEQHGTSGR